MKNFIFLAIILFAGQTNLTYGQTEENNSTNLPSISKAPISYRINESGSKLHGYYKKGYNLTIYGDSSVVGYRADCDKDDDWSGANVGGTTQSSNSFETTFGCVFNPHNLFGTVLPGNKAGQNHFDKLRSQSVGIGDLTLTYKLDKNNKLIDSIVGVVFDRGPQNQPGESSVATCDKFKTQLDNNQFVYLVFPNTAKYLKQIIGTKPNSQKLKRNLTNSDFEEAYKLMLNEIGINKRKQMQNDILNLLSQIPVISNFDNATPQEKADGKLRPKNNDRNLNE